LIKIIYSEVAGGPSDIITRAIAGKMSISLKQSTVIENRPGAGGTSELKRSRGQDLTDIRWAWCLARR